VYPSTSGLFPEDEGWNTPPANPLGCGSATPPAKTSAVEENNCSHFIYFTSSFFFKIARSGDVFGSIFDGQPLDELANKIDSCRRGLGLLKGD
jgi:hypothetical protein